MHNLCCLLFLAAILKLCGAVATCKQLDATRLDATLVAVATLVMHVRTGCKGMGGGVVGGGVYFKCVPLWRLAETLARLVYYPKAAN